MTSVDNFRISNQNPNNGFLNEYPVSVKVYDASKYESFNNDLCFLRKADGHNNLLKVHTCFKNQIFFYLVMDRIDNWDLLEFVSVKFPNKEDNLKDFKRVGEIATFIRGLIEGVNHIHAQSLYHGNLTFNNIIIVGSTPKLLLTSNNEDSNDAQSSDIRKLGNILKYCLKGASNSIEDIDFKCFPEALNLIEKMTNTTGLTIQQVADHPAFWDVFNRFQFYQSTCLLLFDDRYRHIRDILDTKVRYEWRCFMDSSLLDDDDLLNVGMQEQNKISHLIHFIWNKVEHRYKYEMFRGKELVEVDDYFNRLGPVLMDIFDILSEVRGSGIIFEEYKERFFRNG